MPPARTGACVGELVKLCEWLATAGESVVGGTEFGTCRSKDHDGVVDLVRTRRQFRWQEVKLALNQYSPNLCYMEPSRRRTTTSVFIKIFRSSANDQLAT